MKNEYQNEVRIIAGKYKGKKLTVNEAQGLRPTPARVRETVFSWTFTLPHSEIYGILTEKDRKKDAYETDDRPCCVYGGAAVRLWGEECPGAAHGGS